MFGSLLTTRRHLTGAEAMFTAARPRGLNRTNHDESRERGGPGISPDFPVSNGAESERLTSPLTVRSDLHIRWSAQRWAATYSHGGVLPSRLMSNRHMRKLQQV